MQKLVGICGLHKLYKQAGQATSSWPGHGATHMSLFSSRWPARVDGKASHTTRSSTSIEARANTEMWAVTLSIKYQVWAGTVTRGVHQQILLTKIKICLSFTLVCTVTFGSNTKNKTIGVSVKDCGAQKTALVWGPCSQQHTGASLRWAAFLSSSMLT